jgi:uncharacterized cupredoxin-like copper-binding protein
MNFRSVFLKLAGLVFLLILTGCSSAASTPSQPVEVDVTATDFAFQSSMTTFETGVPYHFVVTNEGQVEHEFMIVQPIEAGTMDMEQMDEMAVGHIEEDDLQPGDTASVDVTFQDPAPEGTLEFACHLPGHFEAGMHLPIVVQ